MNILLSIRSALRSSAAALGNFSTLSNAANPLSHGERPGEILPRSIFAQRALALSKARRRGRARMF